MRVPCYSFDNDVGPCKFNLFFRLDIRNEKSPIILFQFINTYWIHGGPEEGQISIRVSSAFVEILICMNMQMYVQFFWNEMVSKRGTVNISCTERV